MHKLLAAMVAATFAFASVSSVAAAAVKKEELTQEQRTEMRNRADQLTRARAESIQVKSGAKQVPATNLHQVKKARKAPRTTAKKAPPKV